MPRPGDDSKQPRARRGAKRETTSVQAALKTSMGPLMRQVRKFTAMKTCLEVLPEELSGLVAPFDVRLAPSRKPGQEGGIADVNTLYLYVSDATVRTVLEKRKRDLMTEINGRLATPFVEEFRYEEAGPQRIQRQLNILALEPD
jgi:hypothetical protein